MEPFQQEAVEAVFESYADELGQKLLALRQLIFDVAAATTSVGRLTETLKWGQPSYLTKASGSGTTVRIDAMKGQPGSYGLFVHCQTSLLGTYRELYGGEIDCVGKRCLRFNVDEDPPAGALRHCIALALTYHRQKRKA